MKKIAIIKKKEIWLSGLAIFFLTVGFFSYNPKVKKDYAKIADSANYPETNLGEATLVSSNSVDENITQTNEIEETSNENDFFLETKMNRDNTYSENLEVYNEMLSNSNITQEQKMIAQNEITNILNEKKAIDSAEGLIKIKGFEDVVIFSNNNKINVIIKSEKLLQNEVAQIQNIIEKEFEINSENITITNR